LLHLASRQFAGRGSRPKFCLVAFDCTYDVNNVRKYRFHISGTFDIRAGNAEL
jgi:hypothetical protein